MKNSERLEGCFLPDFCNIRVVFAVVVAAELLAIILSIVSFSDASEFWSSLGMRSLFIQWIALGSSVLLCFMRSRLKRLSAAESGMLALSIILLVSMIVARLSCGLLVLQTNCEQLMMQTLAVSFIIGLLSLHYLYMQNRLAMQQKAEADARFDALQARIRPHFLFNSMNTIAYLAGKDPAMAEKVTEDLAELFRATMSDANRIGNLDSEIELAQGYLNIEKIRLAERLEVRWHLSETIRQCAKQVELPFLTLQPLLENAIYHGIEPQTEGGVIEITIRDHDDQVIVRIDNPLPIKDNNHKRTAHRQGNQLAQQNIKQRFASMFEENAQVSYSEEGDRYRVVLQFPISNASQDWKNQ